MMGADKFKKRFDQAAIAGDISQIMSECGNFCGESLPGEIATMLQSLQNRFLHRHLDQLSIQDDAIQSLYEVFQRYWLASLMKNDSQNNIDQFFRADLSDWISHRGVVPPATFDENEWEKILQLELKNRGYFSLFGKVAPYWEMMVWKDEETRTFPVRLWDNSLISVKVVFMKDFLILGWLGYATQNRRHTGGWVKPEALYCVADSYQVSDESFQVSFLVHEAQHFVDIESYPLLSQTDLEYRAKLAELIASDKLTLKLLGSFLSAAISSMNSAHSNAAFAIKQEFHRRFGSDIDVDSVSCDLDGVVVRNFALELMRENTERLASRGPNVTTLF